MNILAIFATAFVVAFSGAMMPGPLLTVTVSEAIKRGWRAIWLVVGHAILEVLLVIGFIFGLKSFLDDRDVISGIGIAGGVVLLWMGYSTLSGAIKGTIVFEGNTKLKTQSRWGPVLEGIIISLSNPYWTLWWVTIGARLIVSSLRYRLPGVVIFYSGHILADFVWYGVVIGLLVSGKKFIDQRAYRVILFICGIVLLLLGGWFLISAWQ